MSRVQPLPVAAAVACLACYALYRYLLPRPIPGIPYNKAAIKSLLGDLPAIAKASDHAAFQWILEASSKSEGPLFQIFMTLFGKPSLILMDYREGYDILMHSRAWDRGNLTIAAFKGQVPGHHITMKMGEEWKAHRRLIQDLMTPSFLRTVAAPNIYNSALQLVKLWDIKAKIADGHPFAAGSDIYNAAMDAVLDFTFGDFYAERAVLPQIEALEAADETVSVRKPPGQPVEFEQAPVAAAIAAFFDVAEAMAGVSATGVPRIAWFFKKRMPSDIKITKTRNDVIKEQVEQAVLRIEGVNGPSEIRSAVDHVMEKEKSMADKEGRDPVYWSDAIRDEVLGFIVAGHDTSSTTLLWGIKILSDNQIDQQKLRKSLHSYHAAALAEKRNPTHEEISGANVPYLDAAIEEILRVGGTFLMVDRQSNQDTVLLGHHIPKGTHMFVCMSGPSFTEPARNIDESLRSTASQSANKQQGHRTWSEKDMDVFKPERWLVRENGKESFDPNAGPAYPFGLGLRGCYGRKLAYLELKLVFTLIIWNFELLSCPAPWNSYRCVEEMTRKPKHCYATLKKIEY